MGNSIEEKKPVQQTAEVCAAGKKKELLLPIPQQITDLRNIEKGNITYVSIVEGEGDKFSLIFEFGDI